jgi:two-component system cell cycle sensor histidine kinase/response regulator CckA
MSRKLDWCRIASYIRFLITMTRVRPPGDGEGSRAFYQDALLRLSRLSVRTGRTAEDVMQEAGELVSATLQLARVGIWLLIDDGRAIRCAFLYQRGRLEAYEGTILHATDFPSYFQAIADSRSVAVFDNVGDGLADEFRDAYLAPLGITSMLDVPIYRGGRIAGIICHEHVGPPRLWTELEREFATSVGDITGRLWEESSRLRAQQAFTGYEARLADIQRMSALGRMAAGVAHDFNNVLTGVFGYADLIRTASAEHADIVSHTNAISDIAQAGRRLTSALLAYGLGDGNGNHPRVTALPDIIERSRGVVQIALGKRMTLNVCVAPNVGRVFVDPVQVERILVNLAVNAADASASKGVVTIGLSEGPPPQSLGNSRNRYVLLEVKDSGCGMTPEVRKRVLEPFFTTKGNKGTGLGLAIVNQVATSAGGFVDIDSEVGQGTAVRVYLPKIAEAE